MSIIPPPREQSSAIESTCSGVWTLEQLLAFRGRCFGALDSEPIALVERSLDRADAGRVLGMGAGLVPERERVMDVYASRHAGTVTALVN